MQTLIDITIITLIFKKIKIMKTKLFFLFIIIFNFQKASAFTVDGINYAFYIGTEVAVIDTPDFTGSLIIPANVVYEGTTYTVTLIQHYAFYNCFGITSITIPNTVTEIQYYAFVGCTSLTSVICYNPTPLFIPGTVFYNSNQPNCTLYVPDGSVSSYESAFIWTDFASILPLSTLGIEDLSVEPKVSVYPNPTKDKIYFKELKNISTVNIFDKQGRLVKTSLTKDNYTDLSTFNKGIYIIEILSDHKSYITKVVKE